MTKGVFMGGAVGYSIQTWMGNQCYFDYFTLCRQNYMYFSHYMFVFPGMKAMKVKTQRKRSSKINSQVCNTPFEQY